MPPLPGGPDEKPWTGPCPACGGPYDGERVSVGRDEVEDAQTQPIVQGEPMSLADAIACEQSVDITEHLIVTGSPGVDWVLGGGIPSGIGILIASPAGAGKSTLLIETLRKLALRSKNDLLLYVCSEESEKQMGRRYGRLGAFPPNLQVVHMTDFADIVELLEEMQPRVAAIDSLHDLSGVTDDNGFKYSIGSGTAVTLAAKAIKKLAGEQELTIFCVAHVTKEGNIAGTNTVQHSLDVTLYLNGRKKMVDGRQVIVGPERTLRCDGKSRFTETGRKAYLRMLTDGLHDMGPWPHELPPWEFLKGPHLDE